MNSKKFFYQHLFRIVLWTHWIRNWMRIFPIPWWYKTLIRGFYIRDTKTGWEGLRDDSKNRFLIVLWYFQFLKFLEQKIRSKISKIQIHHTAHLYRDLSLNFKFKCHLKDLLYNMIHRWLFISLSYISLQSQNKSPPSFHVKYRLI